MKQSNDFLLEQYFRFKEENIKKSEHVKELTLKLDFINEKYNSLVDIIGDKEKYNSLLNIIADKNSNRKKTNE